MLLKVVGVARLTRDVELRYLPSGAAVSKLGFAMSKKYKTQSGEQKEDVCFIDGSIFGKLAEVANQYLRKGSKIYLDADLKFEQWEDQQGGKRSKHVLNINTFEMLDSKQESQGSSTSEDYNNNNQAQRQPQYSNSYNSNQQDTPPNQNNPQNQKIPEIDIHEDEIPF